MSCGTVTASLTWRDYCLGYMTFISAGVAAQIAWNALLITLYTLQNTVFPGQQDISMTLTPLYQTTLTITIAMLLLFGSSKCYWIGTTSRISSIVCAAAVAATVGFLGGTTKGFGLLHGIMVLAALSHGLTIGTSLALASTMPVKWTGSVSFGTSMSGVLTLLMWIIAKLLFDMQTIRGVKYGVVLMNAVVVLCELFSVVTYEMFRSKWWVKEIISQSEARGETPYPVTADTLVGTFASFSRRCSAVPQQDPSIIAEPERLPADLELCKVGPTKSISYWRIVKQSGIAMWNMFFIAFGTHCVFPTIAPLEFNVTRLEADIITGSHQVTDFVFRFGTDMVFTLFGVLVPAMWVLTTAVHVRIIFSVLAIVMYVTQFPTLWVMIMNQVGLAATHGFGCVSVVVKAWESAEPDDRPETVVLAQLALEGSVAVSLWFAPLLVLAMG